MYNAGTRGTSRRSVPDPTPRNHHGFHENGSIAAVALSRPGGSIPSKSRVGLSGPSSHVYSSHADWKSSSRQSCILSRIRFCLVSLISRPITSHTPSITKPSSCCFFYTPPLLSSRPVSRAPGTYPHPRANLPEPGVQPFPAYREPSDAIEARPCSASPTTQDIISKRLPAWPVPAAHLRPQPFPPFGEPVVGCHIPGFCGPRSCRLAGNLPFFSLLLWRVSGASWERPPPISYPPLRLSSAASSAIICALSPLYRFGLFLPCARF